MPRRGGNRLDQVETRFDSATRAQRKVATLDDAAVGDKVATFGRVPRRAAPSSRIAATWPTSSSWPSVICEGRDPSRRHRPTRCRIADEPARGRPRAPNSSDSGRRSRHAQVVRRRRKAVASGRHVLACSSRAKTRSGLRTPRDQCRPELLSGPPGEGNSGLRQSDQRDGRAGAHAYSLATTVAAWDERRPSAPTTTSGWQPGSGMRASMRYGVERVSTAAIRS